MSGRSVDACAVALPLAQHPSHVACRGRLFAWASPTAVCLLWALQVGDPSALSASSDAASSAALSDQASPHQRVPPTPLSPQRSAPNDASGRVKRQGVALYRARLRHCAGTTLRLARTTTALDLHLPADPAASLGVRHPSGLLSLQLTVCTGPNVIGLTERLSVSSYVFPSLLPWEVKFRPFSSRLSPRQCHFVEIGRDSIPLSHGLRRSALTTRIHSDNSVLSAPALVRVVVYI